MLVIEKYTPRRRLNVDTPSKDRAGTTRSPKGKNLDSMKEEGKKKKDDAGSGRQETARKAFVEGRREVAFRRHLELNEKLEQSTVEYLLAGLPQSSLEEYLHHMHSHSSIPHVAHQNMAQQDHLDIEIPVYLISTSQGIPTPGGGGHRQGLQE